MAQAKFRIFQNSENGIVKGVDVVADAVVKGVLHRENKPLHLGHAALGSENPIDIKASGLLVEAVNADAAVLLMAKARGGNATISIEDVKEIRVRRHVHGETYKSIGADYGLSTAGVRNVATGGTWQHVAMENYEEMKAKVEAEAEAEAEPADETEVAEPADEPADETEVAEPADEPADETEVAEPADETEVAEVADEQ